MHCCFRCSSSFQPSSGRFKMAPRVPIEQRQVIMRLSLQGVPQPIICSITGGSKTAVSRIIQAFRDKARHTDAKRSGRPRVTAIEYDILVAAAAFVKPFLTARQIADELSINASTETIRRRLKEAGLKSCAAAQKPHLKEDQWRQRLHFALAHERWTWAEWSTIIFSDECTFCTRWDQQQRVWWPMNFR